MAPSRSAITWSVLPSSCCSVDAPERPAPIAAVASAGWAKMTVAIARGWPVTGCCCTPTCSTVPKRPKAARSAATGVFGENPEMKS